MEDQATTGTKRSSAAQESTNRRPRYSRLIIGYGGIAALVVLAFVASADVETASNNEASAVQIIQVWTPWLFYAIVLVGLIVAAYVATRASD